VQDASGDVAGVVVQDRDGLHEISAKSVVLACGGFESNAEWRARYLGRPWDTARVRGTQFNNGDGLRMAIEVGALPYGQWSGCHGTPIDADSPMYGDRELTDKTNRLSYPYSVLINTRGQRFIDEGEDFQFFTYAKTGGAILSQPGGVAFQIFDAKTIPFLEPRYSTAPKPITAETLEDLVAQLPVDQAAFLDALHSYNDAAGEYAGFNPTVHDGVATDGLTPEKTNWAIRLDTPPFRAYSSTGGITFSFGGVRIDSQARVISTDWRPIGGLFACGEMVGGLFHYNYPGGSGLMSGAVFGKIAGRSAAGR
jgi:tricarballylate dehydrogenase